MSDRTTGAVLALLAVTLLVAATGGSTLGRLSDTERLDARLSGEADRQTVGLRSPTPTAPSDDRATGSPDVEPTPTESPVVGVPPPPTERAVPTPPSTDRSDPRRSPTGTETSSPTRAVRTPRPSPTPTSGGEERGDA